MEPPVIKFVVKVAKRAVLSGVVLASLFISPVILAESEVKMSTQEAAIAAKENATSALGAKKEFAFRVFLDEREMGRHTVTVSDSELGTRVSIAADFKVKILFYTAFEYTHRVEELWRDNCLVSIDATTDNNGEELFLNGRQNKSSFAVTSHLGEQSLQECVRSFAYWDLDLLDTSGLLNMQTSEYEATQFEKVGRETLTINSRKFVADKFILTAGEKQLSLWYSPDKEWLALQSQTEDDYLVTYYTEAAYD